MGDGRRGIVFKQPAQAKPAKKKKAVMPEPLANAPREQPALKPKQTKVTESPASAVGKARKARPRKRSRGSRVSGADGDEAPAAGGSATKLLGAGAVRETHGISVVGDCPAPFESFACARKAFGFDLVKALKKQGFTTPTAIQAQSWPLALQGRDLIAVSATGSGKTYAFLLPAFVRLYERGPSIATSPARPRVLVLAPTRELVQQIAADAFKLLIGQTEKRPHYVAVFGGVSKSEQIRKLDKGVDLVFATPGRLLDLAIGDPTLDARPALTLKDASYVVMDEADRILDMGFEPDVRKILAGCPKTGDASQGWGASGQHAGTRRQTLLFTATWAKSVQHIASSFTAPNATQLRIGQVAGYNMLTANSDVKQKICIVRQDQKLRQLQQILNAELKPSETAIIFVATKDGCDEIEQELNLGNDMFCGVLHSGRNQKHRNQALRHFRSLTAGKTEERGVLIATDVASRGLDIPGVALVVIYDFNGYGGRGGGAESYVHRIGRTGRAGRQGRAVTFFLREDEGATELVEILGRCGQAVPQALRDLAMQRPRPSNREQGDSWPQDFCDQPRKRRRT